MNKERTDLRRIVISAVVAMILLLIGFTLGQMVGGEETQGPKAVPGDSSEAESVGPTRMASGVPVGYAPTEEGAVQAAINYARTLSPDPGESKENFARKLRAIASKDWGNGLRSTISSWDEGEGEAAILRFRVADFSEDRAEVALWVAGFINPRNGSPGAVWGRVFLTLAWENGDWKLANEDGDEGPWPTPLSRPSSSEDLTNLLSGFEPIDYEPASLP